MLSTTKRCFAWTIIVALGICACKKEEVEANQRKSIETALVNTDYELIDGMYFVLQDLPCDTIIECDTVRAPCAENPDSTCETVTCNIVDFICPSQYLHEGDEVLFAYVAKIFGGAVFATTDSTVAAQSGIYPQPLASVVLGKGQVIAGVELALRSMAVGQLARVLFPFTLGYGATGAVGQVPSSSPQDWTILVISKK